MTEEQVSNIYTAFNTIPPEAREWLTSKEVSGYITAIANQLILSDDQETTLAFMLVRLATQNIKPENFKQELMKRLAVDQQLAEKITDALKEKILVPIEKPLSFAGVDINLLQYNAPAAINAPATPPPLPIQDKSFGTIQDKPFILHEEPASSPQQSSFIFNAEDTVHPSLQTTPPKVIIERVVHYSAFRTPLAQASVTTKEKADNITIPKSKWFN